MKPLIKQSDTAIGLRSEVLRQQLDRKFVEKLAGSDKIPYQARFHALQV